MSEAPVNTPSTKTRRITGAPKGNSNAVKHGVFGLEGKRKRGQMDRRTTPYRAIAKREREIAKDIIEKRKKWHRGTAARGEYYVERIDSHLLSLKQLVRKGKVNPAVEIRLRLAESVERSYEALSVLEAKGSERLDLARRLQREALNGGKS